jgi:hypothetical protein
MELMALPSANLVRGWSSWFPSANLVRMELMALPSANLVRMELRVVMPVRYSSFLDVHAVAVRVMRVMRIVGV